MAASWLVAYWLWTIEKLIVIPLALNKSKNLAVILLTWNNTKILSSFLLTLNNSKEIILLTLNNTVSQVTFGYLLLTVQHLRYLQDAMPRQKSPALYRQYYGFDRAFFILRRFLPCTPSCCFQGFPGAGSSTSKLARLHVDFWNIAPIQLFVWITAIHKRSTLVGSI